MTTSLTSNSHMKITVTAMATSITRCPHRLPLRHTNLTTTTARCPWHSRPPQSQDMAPPRPRDSSANNPLARANTRPHMPPSRPTAACPPLSRPPLHPRHPHPPSRPTHRLLTSTVARCTNTELQSRALSLAETDPRVSCRADGSLRRTHSPTSKPGCFYD